MRGSKTVDLQGWLVGLGVTALVLLAGASMASAAAADAAGPRAVILHEVGADGASYAGNLHRFGWAMLDADGAPTVHRNAAFEVLQEDRVVFATTADSGHDYDGADRYFVAFPDAGPYEVRVRVPTDDGDQVATFTGNVTERESTEARIDLWLPDAPVAAGEPVTLRYEVVAAGAPVEHAQVWLEVWDTARDTRVFAVDTHGHAGLHELDFAFPAAGEYEVRLTAYHAFPTERALPFAPVEQTARVEVVEPPLPLLPGLPSRAPLENIVESGEAAAPYDLFVTYDPYTATGPWGKMRVGFLVVDAQTLEPVPHVDFSAQLLGPQGDILFFSDSLHAYDGFLEIETSRTRLGDYTLEVAAESTGTGWSGSASALFSVVPPVVALNAGAQYATLEAPGEPVAGEPQSFAVSIVDAADRPFAHGEIGLQVAGGAGGTLAAGKLHTHDDGRYPFTLTFPEAGEYRIHLDPFDLVPSPTPEHHGPEADSVRSFRVQVWPPSTADPTLVLDAGEVPAPAAALLVAIVGLGLGLRRRAHADRRA